MWTYSIESERGKELAHGMEREILALLDSMLTAGRAVRLIMWAPGARAL